MVAMPSIYSIVCRFRNNFHDKCSRLFVHLFKMYQNPYIRNVIKKIWLFQIENYRKTFLQIFEPWWLRRSVHPWAHPWAHGLKIWRKVPMESSIFNLQTART